MSTFSLYLTSVPVTRREKERGGTFPNCLLIVGRVETTTKGFIVEETTVPSTSGSPLLLCFHGRNTSDLQTL